MPPHIVSPYQGWSKLGSELKSELRRYYKPRYNELDLDPSSSFSQKVVSYVMARANVSARWLSTKHDTWDEIQDLCHARITLSEEELARQAADPNAPVSLVFPEAYAQRETFAAALLTTFGSSSPTFRYRGVSSEDLVSAALMERVVESQVRNGKALLGIDSWMTDLVTYGFGAISINWKVRPAKRKGVPTIAYEGSIIKSIDPYLYLPDPNVGIAEVQDGAWVGWLSRESYTSLLQLEAQNFFIFNCRAFSGEGAATSSIYTNSAEYISESKPIDVIWMYCTVMPEELDLPGDAPEVWLFGVAGDSVVICAHKLELDHGLYPVSVITAESSGHDLLPTSKLEIIKGYCRYMGFLANSHMLAVLKMIKMVLLADPRMVNMHDVVNLHTGGVVRVSNPMMGSGVTNGLAQLPLTDATHNHIPEMFSIQQLARTASGAVDAVQGIQRTGSERITAAEFNSTMGQAVSRIRRMALLAGLQGMQDLGRMYAEHTIQYMSQPVWVELVGRYEKELQSKYGQQFVQVTPDMINASYDLEVFDGSTGDLSHTQELISLYQTVMQNPEAAQQIDSVRMLLHIGQLLGIRDVQEFIRRVEPVVLPNEQVMEMEDAGKLYRV